MRESHLQPHVLEAVERLRPIAEKRGQSMVQLALSWVLRRQELTSALIGVRNLDQLKDNLGVLDNLVLSEGEIGEIDTAVKDALIDLHPHPSGWLR
jgi:L-glyceraldehyde 3-phosphate reductase